MDGLRASRDHASTSGICRLIGRGRLRVIERLLMIMDTRKTKVKVGVPPQTDSYRAPAVPVGWPRLTLPLALLGALHGCAVAVTGGDRVACHIDHEGKLIIARTTAVASAYDDAPTRAGSDFLFRIVFQRQPSEHATIKLYTYADKKEGPALIHLARFPYPPMLQGAGHFGFTGLQSVFEPVGGGKLDYWCELEFEVENHGPGRTDVDRPKP